MISHYRWYTSYCSPVAWDTRSRICKWQDAAINNGSSLYYPVSNCNTPASKTSFIQVHRKIVKGFLHLKNKIKLKSSCVALRKLPCSVTQKQMISTKPSLKWRFAKHPKRNISFNVSITQAVGGSCLKEDKKLISDHNLTNLFLWNFLSFPCTRWFEFSNELLRRC